ncbi:MAG: diguanylate cyclase [Methylotenera sp.]|nr:diguanylate cyclase [Methylotenera sp.]
MRLRPNLNSITNRLIIMGMVLLIIGALSRVFLLADFLRADIDKQASSQLVALAQYVAKDIDQDIMERRDFLTRVTNKFPLPLLQNPQQLRRWLSERHDINPLFSKGIFVLDVSGTALIDYPALPGRAGASYANSEYFQRALKGTFVIGRPVIGSATKVPVVPMAMPVLDSMGKIRAILVGMSELQSPNFLEMIYSTRIGATGGLLLVSPRDKLFVGASDASMILTPTPTLGVNKLHDQAMNGFRGVGVTVNARGIEELAAFASVSSSGWFVVARLPTKEAYAPVTHLRLFVIKNTAIIIPLFILFMVLMLRHMMRPLMNAAKHADQMTQGKIPFEPLPVVRHDEVGHLTDAFNRVLSKLLESRAELEHMAHHDTLTGLPNRQLLADRVEQALARAKRNQMQVAVLFLDLDGFKPINDQFGHKAGDMALREVARRLSDIVRREDTVARVGGDEFVILLTDLNDNARNTAKFVANKCLAAFQQPFNINHHSCQLGTSIGIALSTGRNECDSDKLLIAADHAMYKAKKAGRSQLYWADECSTCLSTDHLSDCGANLVDIKRIE